MKDWMKLIPEDEIATYRQAGFLGELVVGRHPALIVVDVTMGFCGSQGLSLKDAIEEFPTACGPAAWEAMPRVAALLTLFRTIEKPVVFTCSDLDTGPFTGKATKSKRMRQMPPRFNDFPAAIAPRAGEWVLKKTKASAFFQTPLPSYLTKQGVDTLVVCGVSTSGCVRASVVDGFSHGYATVVVDDCCFDRSAFAHAANLFDMSAKYASVVSLSELEVTMRSTRQSAA